MDGRHLVYFVGCLAQIGDSGSRIGDSLYDWRLSSTQRFSRSVWRFCFSARILSGIEDSFSQSLSQDSLLEALSFGLETLFLNFRDSLTLWEIIE